MLRLHIWGVGKSVSLKNSTLKSLFKNYHHKKRRRVEIMYFYSETGKVTILKELCLGIQNTEQVELSLVCHMPRML